MTFVSRQPVRFAHVDAAGIVFYPRYFEMVNAAVEDYFAEAIGIGFGPMHLHRRIGVPTVKIEAEFSAPSRLGDELDFRLDVDRLGSRSADLSIEVVCGAETRFNVSLVIVCIDLDSGQSVSWPADLRPRLAVAAA